MAQSLKLQAYMRQKQLQRNQDEEDAYARKEKSRILVLDSAEQSKQNRASQARKLLAEQQREQHKSKCENAYDLF